MRWWRELRDVLIVAAILLVFVQLVAVLFVAWLLLH